MVSSSFVSNYSNCLNKVHGKFLAVYVMVAVSFCEVQIGIKS